MEVEQYMSSDESEYKFSKFLDAQEKVYPKALKEIQAGKKRTHWIWYIFPIIRGFGKSKMCNYYALDSVDEAKEYLQDDLLKQHLIEISEALLQLETNDAHYIFRSPDDSKVQSCMTLFSLAAPNETVFQKVLDKYYNGEQNKKTLVLLEKQNTQQEQE